MNFSANTVFVATYINKRRGEWRIPLSAPLKVEVREYKNHEVGDIKIPQSMVVVIVNGKEFTLPFVSARIALAGSAVAITARVNYDYRGEVRNLFARIGYNIEELSWDEWEFYTDQPSPGHTREELLVHAQRELEWQRKDRFGY